MKELLIIFLVALIVALSGCTSKNNNESFVSDTTTDIISKQENTDTSQNGTTASDYSTSTERSETSENITSSDNSASTTTSSTEKKTENNTESSSSVKPPATESDTNKKPTVSDTTSSNTTKPHTPNSDFVIEQYATAQDADKIAEKVVEYINKYRNNEGVSKASVLPDLTKYAKYRSQQLIINFAHDTFDERAAATALKYGEYVDPVLYGMTGEPYYTANAREAIGKGSLFGTIEQTATRIADGFRNSKGHWSYVGSSEYKYIAVGITCKNGYWYCDIAVSTVNTDN